MKNIVIYSNCQGTIALKHFLNKYTPQFIVICISNYELINIKGPLPVDILQSCDVFIYQPIQNQHGIYSTDINMNTNILSYLQPNCIKISFPYIYFPCIFTFNAFEKYGLPHNFDANMLNFDYNSQNALNSTDKSINKFIVSGLEDVSKKYIENSKNMDMINTLYDNHLLSFNFENRLNYILENLRKREEHTDIKVSQYILDNLNHKILFFTHNHPTSYIFIHIINQIYKLLHIEKINHTMILLNDANLPVDFSNMIFDSYNYKYYNFQFKNDDPIVYITDFNSYLHFYSKNDEKAKHLIRTKLNEIVP